jgi:DNA-binding response OmpR family regulator
MARGSILLLEQNQKIASTVEAAARRAGYRFQGLPWGEDVIGHLNSHDVDVILMNMRQIGSTVRAICNKIREQAQFRRFPLIIVYGKSIKDERIDLLKLGADDFMPMPFVPVNLIALIDARLRPLRDLTTATTTLTELDKEAAQTTDKIKVPVLQEKGDLEEIPLATIFARIFFNQQSGILNLIIKKETRTVYFENGNVIYSESLSKKDDLGDFMARNSAGTGTGKDILAARAQAGGPGCDPRELREILRETRLMDAQSFSWWQRLFIQNHLTSLFTKNLGTFQWQRLPLPDYVNEADLEPIYTPQITFEGIRNLLKWWNYRQKLPPEESVPKFTGRFEQLAVPYGLTDREINMLKVIDGKRNLSEIRELCHRVAQGIDNYIYACREFQLISFEKIKTESSKIDIHAALEDEDEPEAPVTEPVSEPEIPSMEPADETPEPDEDATTAPLIPPEDTPPSDAVDNTEQDSPLRPIPTVNKTAESEGRIEELQIPEIFRLCIKQHFSGKTEFSRDEQKKTIYWKKGKIVTAMSDSPEEGLDNYLYKNNLINEDQKASLSDLDPGLSGSPNELLKRGFITIEQIFTVVRDHTESILKDMFNWTDGSYQLTPDFPPPKNTVPMDLSPEVIIINGLREIKDWNLYESRLPKPNDRVKLNRETKLNQSGLALSPLELRILNVLVEPLPASAVISRVDAETDDVLHSLYGMELIGLIHHTGGGV